MERSIADPTLCWHPPFRAIPELHIRPNSTDWSLSLVLAAVLGLSAAAIFLSSGTAFQHPMDQGFVYVDLTLRKTAAGWEFHYPRLGWSGGITASLLVGAYKLVIPTSVETLNWHVRMLAATLYLVSAAGLVRAFVRDRIDATLCMAAIGLSGLQLLEPSSEPIAGGLFALLLLALHRRWPAVWTSLLLVAFGLCKVELLLAAGVIAVLWGRADPGRRLGWSLAWLLVLLGPSLYLYGPSGLASGRAADTLAQHYEALMHQPAPASSPVRMVLDHPGAYLAFLAASLLASILATGAVLKLLLVILPTGAWRRVWRDEAWRFAVIGCVLSLVPAMLLAYIHVRYLGRYYPALVVLSYCLWQGRPQKHVRWALGLSALLNLATALAIARAPHEF